MIRIIYNIFEWAFVVRVAIAMILVFSLWILFGKKIIWILSSVPYLIGKVFVLLFYIIKIPIVFLHKILGGVFCKLDNKYSDVGEGIHAILEKWYKKWHCDYEIQVGKSFLVMLICYLVIVIPYYARVDIDIFNMGRDIYCLAENRLKNHIEETHPQSELENNQMVLVVYDVKNSLYVRDIPNRDEGKMLEELYNGDRVIWNGEMVFVEWKNDEVVPLVKVVTENGTEGWSLLNYLYLEDYENIELKVVGM